MTYLDDVEKELRDLLHMRVEDDYPDNEDWVGVVVAFVRKKLLESYKNGAQAARRQSQKGSQKQYKKGKASR